MINTGLPLPRNTIGPSIEYLEICYKNGDRNIEAAAHLKASTVGASQTVIVRNEKLLLVHSQGIYFCEFDGPLYANLLCENY